MFESRVLVGLAVSALVTFVACSDDSSTGTTSSSGGSSSGGSSGGGSSGSAASSGFKQCPPSGTKSKCTDAELQEYGKCYQNACGEPFKECYGPDYQSGTFSGPCATFIKCTQACDCNDTACAQKCTLDEACSACVQKTFSCGSDCPVPACAGG